MENNNFVLPKVFWIGATEVNLNAITEYLTYTDQKEFLDDIQEAMDAGLNSGEILCSFYAKLCYASLTDKKNKNITRTRSIANNIRNVIETQHGSVLEHCSLNFVVTDCSRIYTHEQVRHRPGTAYSQTSGRYVRNDVLKLVVDPILEPVYDSIEAIRATIEMAYKGIEKQMMDGVSDFDKKKKITSALRRILPNGQVNEIGVSINLRMLRQTIEARTSRHAEWEIRLVFNQIYNLVKDKYPMMFADSVVLMVDSQYEVTFANKKI